MSGQSTMGVFCLQKAIMVHKLENKGVSAKSMSQIASHRHAYPAHTLIYAKKSECCSSASDVTNDKLNMTTVTAHTHPGLK